MKIQTPTTIVLAICSLASVHGATIVASAADANYVALRTSQDDNNTFDGGTGTNSSLVSLKGSLTSVVQQIGATTSNTEIGTAITPFLLPTLMAGQSFTNVSFSVGHSNTSNANRVTDLYGLGRRASSTVLASDYYVGTTGGDTTDATLIQAGFVDATSSSVGDIETTSATGITNLTAYLNNQYAGGAGAGEYIFLRMNVDADHPTSNGRLNIASQDHATSAIRPVITYDVIPEPSSALLSLVGMVFLARRKR